MSGTHSILAPSDSSRWLRCVGALYLSRGIEDPDKEHSASGSLSHLMLQQILDGLRTPESYLGQTDAYGGFTFTIDQDRIDRVMSCVNNINREPGMYFTETRLDTTPVLGVPNQQGHSDIIKLYPEGGVMKDGQLLRGVLTVHDYKDGYILVPARDNTQGLIYLCAAMFQFSLCGEFEAYRFCIHQPKINHYDEWTYTRAELEAFMTLIRPVAKLAYDIYHETVPFDPKAHLAAGDEQCTFCPVRGRCPARAARVARLFEPLIRRHELDDESIGILYGQLDEIEAAVSDFRSEALRRAKMGVEIQGQKLVYGNRGKRKWTDERMAEVKLYKLLKADAYEPRTIISPTEAEKLLKKDYAPLASLVTQSDPQLRLVPLAHKGDAVKIQGFDPVKDEESLI
jgi:hypothetical protein